MRLVGTETSAEQVKDWWKDLYERYRQDVETQLIQIIQDYPSKKQQINVLSDFLKTHHEFIEGTCLDYIAIPLHPVTI